MRITLIILCLFVEIVAYSQSQQEKDLKFAQYLVNTRQSEDAIHFIKSLPRQSLSEDHQDTLHFLLGKSYYQLQDLTNSAFHFSKLNDPQHPLYVESRFFESFNYLHLEKTEEAISILNQLSPEPGVLNGLRNFEVAGAYLLKREYALFDTLARSFDQQYYQFSAQEKSLLEVRKDLAQHKRKSPLMAGIFSSIIPGSGKIYAGKTGQGIAGLLTTGILGLQALEGYRKDGADSARFLIFGSVFSIFYIGNIWGSVFTVKLTNDEFNEAVDHQILFDLHIPLRTVFH